VYWSNIALYSPLFILFLSKLIPCPSPVYLIEYRSPTLKMVAKEEQRTKPKKKQRNKRIPQLYAQYISCLDTIFRVALRSTHCTNTLRSLIYLLSLKVVLSTARSREHSAFFRLGLHSNIQVPSSARASFIVSISPHLMQRLCDLFDKVSPQYLVPIDLRVSSRLGIPEFLLEFCSALTFRMKTWSETEFITIQVRT
jgi:hypothetical protein